MKPLPYGYCPGAAVIVYAPPSPLSVGANAGSGGDGWRARSAKGETEETEAPRPPSLRRSRPKGGREQGRALCYDPRFALALLAYKPAEADFVFSFSPMDAYFKT